MKDLQEDMKVPDSIGNLQKIHSSLTLKHGHITWENEEQVMAVKFIKPDCKVLEFGANIGRNTLVISSLLSDPTNLVALECDPISVAKLEENKSLNKYNFHIEPSALSKRKLIQKDWDTIPSDDLIDGYTRVNTITYSELIAKYNIPFDTIVADCEGALFYILTDMPEVLTNIKLIIMENDYYNIEHKEFVDSVLTAQGFERIYCKSGGWEPCYKFFWETWQKK
jgi:FkbM family methyltransferase